MLEEISISEAKIGDFILEYKKTWSQKWVRIMEMTEKAGDRIYVTLIDQQTYMEYYDDQTDKDLFEITERVDNVTLVYSVNSHHYYTNVEFFKITGLELNRLLIGAI